MSDRAGDLDTRSLHALREAYLAAPGPTFADLIGEHEAEFVGPAWMRWPSPASVAVAGMPGWCGKRFEGDARSTDRVVGVNLVRRRGQVVDSFAMVARLGPSRLDGRAALLVTYPDPAPFPWTRIIDELRPIGTGTLLGRMFGLPKPFQGGLPFLLHRVPVAGTGGPQRATEPGST